MLHPRHIPRLRCRLNHLRAAALDGEHRQRPAHLPVRLQREPAIGADEPGRLSQGAHRVASAAHHARERCGVVGQVRDRRRTAPYFAVYACSKLARAAGSGAAYQAPRNWPEPLEPEAHSAGPMIRTAERSTS